MPTRPPSRAAVDLAEEERGASLAAITARNQAGSRPSTAARREIESLHVALRELETENEQLHMALRERTDAEKKVERDARLQQVILRTHAQASQAQAQLHKRNCDELACRLSAVRREVEAGSLPQQERRPPQEVPDGLRDRLKELLSMGGGNTTCTPGRPSFGRPLGKLEEHPAPRPTAEEAVAPPAGAPPRAPQEEAPPPEAAAVEEQGAAKSQLQRLRAKKGGLVISLGGDDDSELVIAPPSQTASTCMSTCTPVSFFPEDAAMASSAAEPAASSGRAPSRPASASAGREEAAPAAAEFCEPGELGLELRDNACLVAAVPVESPPADEDARRRSEEAAKKAADEEDVRKKAEEDARRKAAEEEAAKKAEEAAKKAAEDEDARRRSEEAAKKAADEEDVRKKAEEDARRKAAEEEAAKKAEEAAKKAAEDEDARRRSEEAAKKAADEEDIRKKAEEDAKRKAAEEEKALKDAEEAAKKAADEEDARKAAEEAAKKRAAEEEENQKKAEAEQHSVKHEGPQSGEEEAPKEAMENDSEKGELEQKEEEDEEGEEEQAQDEEDGEEDEDEDGEEEESEEDTEQEEEEEDEELERPAEVEGTATKMKEGDDECQTQVSEDEEDDEEDESVSDESKESEDSEQEEEEDEDVSQDSDDVASRAPAPKQEMSETSIWRASVLDGAGVAGASGPGAAHLARSVQDKATPMVHARSHSSRGAAQETAPVGDRPPYAPPFEPATLRPFAPQPRGTEEGSSSSSRAAARAAPSSAGSQAVSEGIATRRPSQLEGRMAVSHELQQPRQAQPAQLDSLRQPAQALALRRREEARRRPGKEPRPIAALPAAGAAGASARTTAGTAAPALRPPGPAPADARAPEAPSAGLPRLINVLHRSEAQLRHAHRGGGGSGNDFWEYDKVQFTPQIVQMGRGGCVLVEQPAGKASVSRRESRLPHQPLKVEHQGPRSKKMNALNGIYSRLVQVEERERPLQKSSSLPTIPSLRSHSGAQKEAVYGAIHSSPQRLLAAQHPAFR